MATRAIFETIDTSPFFNERTIDFKWNQGLNINQQRKNVAEIHKAYADINPHRRVLEISSKSIQPEGLELSAFKLEKYVPSLDKFIPVENLYQGGKVFDNGGPYLNLYSVAPIEAKRESKQNAQSFLTGFYYEGIIYPAEHSDAFYNWLYINALIENPSLSKPLLSYDAFTDVDFNPKTGTSCQAKSAAIFVGLSKSHLLDKVKEFDEFVRTVCSSSIT